MLERSIPPGDPVGGPVGCLTLVSDIDPREEPLKEKRIDYCGINHLPSDVR